MALSANRGGARPGAGRKPKATKNETAINLAEKRIRDRLPEIVDAQIALSLGILVQETDDEGTVVYAKAPDVKAGQYLIDRIMGKPTNRTELSGQDGGPIQVEAQKFDYATSLADIAPADTEG